MVGTEVAIKIMEVAQNIQHINKVKILRRYFFVNNGVKLA